MVSQKDHEAPLSLAKWVIELQKAIEAPNPSVIILARVAVCAGPYDARHPAGPAAVGRSSHHFALDAYLHADGHAGLAFAIDAHLEFSPPVLLAQLQDHLGIQRQAQGSEAEASGADGGDEERLDERVHDATAGG